MTVLTNELKKIMELTNANQAVIIVSDKPPFIVNYRLPYGADGHEIFGAPKDLYYNDSLNEKPVPDNAMFPGVRSLLLI